MNESTLRQILAAVGQEHVLAFWNRLSSESRARLAAQIEAFDLPALGQLARTLAHQASPPPLPAGIEPVEAFPTTPDANRRPLYLQARQRGLQMLRDGKIAAFLVAGGQGTRLGYDGPKGEFPITPVKNKPLFQVFAEQIKAAGRDAGRAIPWYVMTSQLNDAATRTFFQQRNFFGLDNADVFFFEQGMMPAFSPEGKILLSAQDGLALSPDGHGGSLRALARSAALADMLRRGVEHLSYFQVDNPLVHCIDPLFLGLHDLTQSEMSSKTIPKSDALEKVGNFVRSGQALHVIEYSDMPPEMAQQTLPGGELRFNAGSIAIHALRVSFVERLNRGGSLALPWHRALKKVPCVDADGNPLQPQKPNAVKFEQFVFDAIPLAANAMVYTTDRSEEFSPVKNADGVDSPATCRRDQVRRAAKWLGECGVEIPLRQGEPDAVLEISPLYALDALQLHSRKLPLRRLSAGQTLYLD